ncbi:MAG TPA: hypothetical protein DD440_07045 [Porticoccaceae bacterium]|nr:hypothetical protein [Porticoccaceae bacterium]
MHVLYIGLVDKKLTLSAQIIVASCLAMSSNPEHIASRKANIIAAGGGSKFLAKHMARASNRAV